MASAHFDSRQREALGLLGSVIFGSALGDHPAGLKTGAPGGAWRFIHEALGSCQLSVDAMEWVH
jgi:hypothetical protein